MTPPSIAVLSSSWARVPQSEIAVAVRSIAGALSRLGSVNVFVPGSGPTFADGAFDVTPIAGVPRMSTPYRAIVVEATSEDLDELTTSVAALSAGAPSFSVGTVTMAADGIIDGGTLDVGIDSGSLDVGIDSAIAQDRRGGDVTPVVHHVGLFARVHPGASNRLHYGLGSIPAYLLVLGDRPGVPSTRSPSDLARWLLARFPREHVVVLEGGVARAWRSRSCVAQFAVHTRMDMWILMARAWGVVDLLPGEVYARECVEALRYGVPVVVPCGGVAERLAVSAGGMRFSSTATLLSCVEALGDPVTRARSASEGRQVADRWYGDPRAFVARVASALGLEIPPEPSPG